MTCDAIQVRRMYGLIKKRRGVLFILAVALSLGFAQVASALGNITTAVGTGDPGFAGDGGQAAIAHLNGPIGITFDGAGNLFIVDQNSHIIRKVATDGVITSIAGRGAANFSGDGGLATSATLDTPSDVAVDGAGNIYIADTGNHRIRKIDTSGIITTFVGTGVPGFLNGAGAMAQVNSPTGLAFDGAGNLLIADTGNHRIRKVTSGGFVTTFAGSAVQGNTGDTGKATGAQLNSPIALAIDATGNVYFTDSGNNRVRKVNTSGIITAFAGIPIGGFDGDRGLATLALLSSPGGIAVDADGNVFISDLLNERIRMVKTSGIIRTLGGTGIAGYSGDNGPVSAAQVNSPKGLAFDGGGNLFVADFSNHRIRRVDEADNPPEPTYIINTIAGDGTFGFGGDGGDATLAQFANGGHVTIDGAGNVYIADSSNHRIRKVDSSGIITTFAGTGKGAFGGDTRPAVDAQIQFPAGIEADAAGNIYIADAGNHRIRKVDISGIITTVAGSGTPGAADGAAAVAQFNSPNDVAIDGAGNLFIADTANQRIRKIDTSGNVTTIAGTGAPGNSGDDSLAINALLNGPTAVAVDASGNIFIADRGNHRIRKVDTGGIITAYAGQAHFGFEGDGGPAIAARMINPEGISIDATGNLIISDTGNNRLRKVTPEGIITTFAGTGSPGFSGDGGPALRAKLQNPRDLAHDAAGNLFLTDTINRRIRKVSQNAGPPFDIITSAAGNSVAGFTGDGGQATNAQLSSPTAVTFDNAGNLFIADAGNHSIRKIDTSGVMSTVAGDGLAGFVDGASARLNSPGGLRADAAGNIFVADTGNGRIRKIDTAGNVTTVAGRGGAGFGGDGMVATSGTLNIPMDVAIDATGNLFIADSQNHRIRKVDTSGIITTAVGTGVPGFFDAPVAFARLNTPNGIAFDRDGNLLIADTFNHRIRKLDSSGNVTTVAGNGFGGFNGDGGPATNKSLNFPRKIAVDAAGNIFIADLFNHRIRKVDKSGIITTVTGDGIPGFLGDGYLAIDARVSFPWGVAINGSGNLFIADAVNNRIREVGPPGGPAPTADTITPATTGPTNAASVDFTVTFSEDVVNFDAATDVVVTHTGTANTGVTISGGPATYTASVTGISGDGSFTLAVNTGSDVQDLSFNALSTSVTSVAVIIDNTPPIITVTNPALTTVEFGGTYVEPGGTAFDAVDGTVPVITGGDTVDPNAPIGTVFTVTFDATDSAGNSAVQGTRTVTVIDGGAGDTTPPVITVTNPGLTTVEFGGTYVEPGATATDDVDGSVSVTVGGDTVNPNAALGTMFTVTYDAVDAAGNNAAQATRKVTVINSTPLVVTVDTLSTNDSTPALSGTIDDAGASISVSVNGQNHAAANNGATWTLADNTLSTLPPATYDVSVTATANFRGAGSDATTNELTITNSSPGNGGVITINLLPDQIFPDDRLEMTAPAGGSSYVWKKDDAVLGEDAPRVTGASNRMLVIDPVEPGDAGNYTVSYDDGVKKATVETVPFTIIVQGAFGLPATARWMLGLLTLTLLLAGVAIVKRRQPENRTSQ